MAAGGGRVQGLLLRPSARRGWWGPFPQECRQVPTLPSAGITALLESATPSSTNLTSLLKALELSFTLGCSDPESVPSVTHLCHEIMMELLHNL